MPPTDHLSKFIHRGIVRGMRVWGSWAMGIGIGWWSGCWDIRRERNGGRGGGTGDRRSRAREWICIGIDMCMRARE